MAFFNIESSRAGPPIYCRDYPYVGHSGHYSKRRLIIDQSAASGRYDVQLFALLPARVSEVAADSPREAVEQAGLQLTADDLRAQWEKEPPEIAYSHFAVWECPSLADAEPQVLFVADHPLLTLLRRLVAWDEAGRMDDLELAGVLSAMRQILSDAI